LKLDAIETCADSDQPVLVDIDPMVFVERIASHRRTFLMS
jgi:hypothetical protein